MLSRPTTCAGQVRVCLRLTASVGDSEDISAASSPYFCIDPSVKGKYWLDPPVIRSLAAPGDI